MTVVPTTPAPAPDTIDADATKQAVELLRILSIPDWQLALNACFRQYPPPGA
jgi:hypothetical protein